jgi:hypothetical protein
MALAVDVVSAANVGTTKATNTSSDITHTVSASATGVLFVLEFGISGDTDANFTAWGLTWGGSTPTLVSGSRRHSGNVGDTFGFIELYWLGTLPGTGAQTFHLQPTFTGGSPNSDWTGYAISVTGALAGSPLGTAQISGGELVSSVTVTDTLATGDLFIAGIVNGTTVPGVTTGTSLASNAGGALTGSHQIRIADNTGSGSVSIVGSTDNTDFSAISGVKIIAATTTATTVLDQRLLCPPGLISPSGRLFAVGDRTATGGTIFTASLSGTVTPAGALTKQANKALAGTVTPAGALAKLIAKPLAGTVTPAGALAKQANKALAGSMASSGALTKAVSKALAGTVTPTGALAKLVNKVFAGTVTPAGVLTTIKVVLRSFAGTLTPAGALTRSTAKGLTSTTTPAGALAKAVSKPLAGSAASSGALAKQTGKALAGSMASSGTLVRLVGKALAGTLTPTGTIGKLARKALTGALAIVGTLATTGGGGTTSPDPYPEKAYPVTRSKITINTAAAIYPVTRSTE